MVTQLNHRDIPTAADGRDLRVRRSGGDLIDCVGDLMLCGAMWGRCQKDRRHLSRPTAMGLNMKTPFLFASVISC